MSIRELVGPDPHNRETFEPLCWNLVNNLNPWAREVTALGQIISADKDAVAQLKQDVQAIKSAGIAEITTIKESGEGVVEECEAIKNLTINAKESALQARDEAWNTTNYKGAWLGLSGALSIPASVSHDGLIWMLVENVADVTQAEPGQSDKWQMIRAGHVVYIPTPPPDQTQPMEETFRVPRDAHSSVTADIAGLGRFVWVADCTDLKSPGSCLLCEGQDETTPGRWKLLQPSWEAILAEMILWNDRLRMKIKSLEQRVEALES